MKYTVYHIDIMYVTCITFLLFLSDLGRFEEHWAVISTECINIRIRTGQ